MQTDQRNWMIRITGVTILAGGLLVSCTSTVSQARVVDLEGSPIAGATVYIETTERTWFDSSPHIWQRQTEVDGSFDSRTRYDLTAVFVLAKGFYPGTSNEIGKVVLQPIPPKTLTVRAGSCVIKADGTVQGFSFARGERVGRGAADIIPMQTKITPTIRKIQALGKGGFRAAGLSGLQKAKITSGQLWCVFLRPHVPGNGGWERGRWHKTVGGVAYRHRWGQQPWVVRCRDGAHYAVVLPTGSWTSADETEQVVKFQYIYQPVIGGALAPAFDSTNSTKFKERLPLSAWHQ